MKCFCLGIDASKGYSDFLIVDMAGEAVEPNFQLDDTSGGHRELYGVLARLVEAHPDAQILAAIEATGGYEANWLHALKRFQATLPIKVARVNPALVRKHAEAEGCRNTTDATSAYHIATFQIAHPKKVHYDQDDSQATLRAQWTFLEQLKKQRTALLNHLESVVYRAQPSLVASLTGGTPAWILKLLKQYPTAERLSRARPKTVARIPFVTLERARTLIETARNSVASATDKPTEHLVSDLAGQVLHLGDLIKRHEQILSEEFELPEDVELLKSYGHIGDYSAVGLLLEIGPVERFASVKHLASFCGIHPVSKKSGDGTWAIKMSKQGSARVRALLYMVTLGAIQDHPIIAPLYKRLVEDEGKEKMVAIVACMHKTLRILYGILTSRRPFDPEVDRVYRQRGRRVKSASEPDPKRRHQDYDPSAPISDRAKKRRRLRKDSQDAIRTEYGMSPSTAAIHNQPEQPTKSSIKKQTESA
jgi:transposase